MNSNLPLHTFTDITCGNTSGLSSNSTTMSSNSDSTTKDNNASNTHKQTEDFTRTAVVETSYVLSC